jgi:hypothetical protein
VVDVMEVAVEAVADVVLEKVAFVDCFQKSLVVAAVDAAAQAS